MEVTLGTWTIALAGLVLIGLLGTVQLAALLRPRARWTVEAVYGGDPAATDPTAYFAFNRGFGWADVLLWAPLQVAASVGMLLGQEWGYLLALTASVPYVYSAIPLFVWDRDLGFRGTHWVVSWGMWPAFGLAQAAFALWRLLG